MIKGYKAFNSDKTNRYGIPFEEGKAYKVDGDISFGNQGNGFHMCTSISDVFRYIDASDINNYKIAVVYGYGDSVLYEDDYEGYYDMYACRCMYVKKFLTRSEVFEIFKELNDWQVLKVIKTSKLLPKEIIFFKNKFSNNAAVMCALLYYQFGDKDVYKKYYSSWNRSFLIDNLNLRLVNKNG